MTYMYMLKLVISVGINVATYQVLLDVHFDILKVNDVNKRNDTPHL